jgi:hypothetical protein
MDSMSSTEDFYTAWLSKLVNGVQSQAARFPSANLYALMDGAQIEKITSQISKWKTAFSAPLFRDDKEAMLTDISPWLVLGDKTQPQTKFIKRCIELQGTTHALIWLISPMKPQDLFDALHRRTNAQLSGGLEMMLRYFDTYRLPDLHNVLDEGQTKAFFGCANAWVYINRQGELGAIDSEFNTQDTFNELVFDDLQEEAILDAAYPDELLRILQQDQADLVENLPPQERYDQVKALLKLAKTYGIEGSKDLLYFCIVGLSEGEGFDTTPEWTTKLNNAKNNKIPFAEAAMAAAT